MVGLNVLLALPTLAIVCVLFFFRTLRKQTRYGIDYYYSGIAGTDRILAMVLFGVMQAVGAVILNVFVMHHLPKWLLFGALSFIVTLVVLRVEFSIYSSRRIPNPSQAYPKEEWQ